MKWIFCLFFLSLFLNLKAQNDYDIEGVEVTAYKYDEIKSYLANPVYSLTSDYIANNPGVSLSSLLNQLPGIHIENANGNQGSPQQYTMRGGQTSDISILINGIPISDDSQISNFQDLNLIDTNQIERIEVVTGGSSTLYGSSASAGIINIIMKDAFKRPSAQAKLNYGSWNDLEVYTSATIPLIEDKLQIRPSYGYTSTSGFSSATDSIGNQNFDKDPSSKLNYSLDLGWYLTDDLQVSIKTMFANQDFDFDQGAFSDGSNRQTSQQWVNNIILTSEQNKGKTTLTINYIDNQRNQYDEGQQVNGLFSQFISSQISGDVFQLQKLLDNRVNLDLLGGLSMKRSETDQFGVDYLSNQFIQNISSDSAKFTLIDPYISILGSYDEFGIDLGARYHIHSQYDNQFVYHIKPTINVINTYPISLAAKAGFYTSYITPSLYQLYSIYGDKNLKPEQSKSVEFSFSGRLFNQINYSATWYKRKELNNIGFSNLQFQYVNVTGESNAKGLEFLLSSQLFDRVDVRAFYGKNKRDKSIDSYKLPKEKWGLTSQWRINESFLSSTDYQFVGVRSLPYFSTTTYTLETLEAKPYHVLNQRLIYNGAERIQLFGAINNILNQNYLDNLGYNSTSRNVMFGLQYDFN